MSYSSQLNWATPKNEETHPRRESLIAFEESSGCAAAVRRSCPYQDDKVRSRIVGERRSLEVEKRIYIYLLGTYVIRDKGVAVSWASSR